MSRIRSILCLLSPVTACFVAAFSGSLYGQAPTVPTVESLVVQLASEAGAARLATLDHLMDRGAEANVAVPAVMQLLKDPDVETRGHAARTLGAIGPAAAPAVDALAAALGDSSPRVRAYAAYALGMIGPQAERAFSKLAEHLTDEDAEVRREVVKALRRLHVDMDVLVPVLVKVLEKSSSDEVMTAMHAMAEAGKSAVPALIQSLNHPEARYYACQILADIGPDAAEAAPAVTGLLADPLPEIRREATLCLGHIGPAAKSSASLILALTDDTDPGTRAASMWAAQMVGAAPDEILPKAKARLNDSDMLVRLVATWTVTKLDPSDVAGRAKAVETFVAAMSDKSPMHRAAAARAMIDLKVDDPAAKQAFAHAIGDGDEVVREVVSQAVLAKGAEAVPRLIAALEKPELRGFAASLLAQLGPQAKEAKAALEQHAADTDPHLRAAVTAALAMTSGDDPAVLAQTIKALDDVNGQVRTAAADGFEAIGPGAKSALDALKKHAEDADPAVREAVARAIYAINQ